jgi:cytoskeletal protein RodZ
MPQSIAIGLLVLGGVLLLVAVTGGKFKIFVAEVDSPVSNTPVRILAGVLGVAFIVTSLVQGNISGSTPAQTNANTQSASPSSPASGATNQAGSAATSEPKNVPSPQPIPVAQKGQAADSDSSDTSDAPSASNASPKSVVSSNEYAVVFDPPSNIRVAPSKSSDTLCSVTAKTAIRILGTEGNWYQTDICNGRVGYIYRNQVKF